MIVASGHTGVNIDLGREESGMVLQKRERRFDWGSYLIDGTPVTWPIDIDTLPSGEYRLV